LFAENSCTDLLLHEPKAVKLQVYLCSNLASLAVLESIRLVRLQPLYSKGFWSDPTHCHQYGNKDAIKEVALEVNTEKTKYMLLSRHQNAGQHRNIKITNMF
jgi:hypothetical protein